MSLLDTTMGYSTHVDAVWIPAQNEVARAAGARLRVSGAPGVGILVCHLLCWCSPKDEGERLTGVLTTACVKLVKNGSSHIVEQPWWGIEQ